MEKLDSDDSYKSRYHFLKSLPTYQQPLASSNVINKKMIQNGNGKSKNGNGARKPLKFLFVSWESLSGDLAWQIKKEGHEVKAYVKSPDDQDVYDGFLEKIPEWKPYIEWADVIVFDDVSFGPQADELRKAGKLVVGGSRYTDRLEEDREFGQAEMKSVGMTILPHWDFNDYATALKRCVFQVRPIRRTNYRILNTLQKYRAVRYIHRCRMCKEPVRTRVNRRTGCHIGIGYRCNRRIGYRCNDKRRTVYWRTGNRAA